MAVHGIFQDIEKIHTGVHGTNIGKTGDLAFCTAGTAEFPQVCFRQFGDLFGKTSQHAFGIVKRGLSVAGAQGFKCFLPDLCRRVFIHKQLN